METTYGAPDGPMRFVDSLGLEVPTYINPRDDLVSDHARGKMKSVDYHIPFAMRGDFTPEDWPENYRRKAGHVSVSAEGFVLCTGTSKSTGQRCASKAVNRTLFCRNHGGALHPADKIMSAFRDVQIPQDRLDRMDRVQQFMKDIITVEDLDDDEIRGGFVRDSQGNKVSSRVIGIAFEQKITKELHRRLNSYIRSKAPRALEVVYEIADSDMVEPADRLKAASMLLDRTLGKSPDVLITATTEKPYEAILGGISGGSREEHRKNVASTRGASRALDQLVGIQDAEEVDLSEMDDGEETDALERQDSERDLRSAGNFDGQRENLDQSGSPVFRDSGSDDYDTGSENETSTAVDAIANRRAAFKAKKDALKKAKARRFAARAVGATSLENMGFGLEWTLIKSGKYLGKLRLRLVSPDAMTEARLAKMASTNELTDAALALLYPPDQGEDNG